MRRVVLAILVFCSCEFDGEYGVGSLQYYAPLPQEVDDRFCGDDVCDVDLGEGWKNCFDCVDLITGLPKNGGYCGDGFCNEGTENLILCPKDCRPLPLNKNPEIGPGPGPLPGPY